MAGNQSQPAKAAGSCQPVNEFADAGVAARLSEEMTQYQTAETVSRDEQETFNGRDSNHDKMPR